MRFYSFVIALLLCCSQEVHAKRLAFIVGNDGYQNVSQLQKAVNDAKAVASTMRSLGFDVLEKHDVDRRTMDQYLTKLENRIEVGDEVLFFFAGHGISVRGRNYLLPTDIPKIAPGQERSITKEAFSEDEIISLLQERGARVSLLIIDACRNNPFPKKGTRSIGRSVGLGTRANPPKNTFVLYSAGIGQQALDRLSNSDENPNSVFTRKLLPLLKQPGLSHVQMAKRLQIEVEKLALTAEEPHQQFPAFYDQVRGNFFLIPGEEKTAKHSTLKQPKANSPSADDELWAAVKSSKSSSDFEFYLNKYPTGKFAAVAELKIKQFKTSKTALNIPSKKSTQNRRRSLKPGEKFKDCEMCPEMIVVPKGKFKIGSPRSEKGRGKDEGPQKTIEFYRTFAAGKFEVTWNEWEECVAEGGCNGVGPEQRGSDHGWGKGTRPVIAVTWYDAKAYVKWLSIKTNRTYRLLSEAEWEYIARAGTKTPYPNGKKITATQVNYAEYYKKNGKLIDNFREKTIAVKSLKPNPWGFYHMLGNVYEWVEDCYRRDYKIIPNNGSPSVLSACSNYVARGGNWESSMDQVRFANRQPFAPDMSLNGLGFRVAKDLMQ